MECYAEYFFCRERQFILYTMICATINTVLNIR